MAQTRTLRLSFAGGEISPQMYGRWDDARNQSGVALMRNFVAYPQGAARSRPGFEHIGAVKTASKKTRLVPFIYSTAETFVVEMGDFYFRFWQNGAAVTAYSGTPTAWNAGETISSFNTTTEAVDFGSAHTFVVGDPVQFKNLGGTLPTPLAYLTTYYVRSIGATTVTLSATLGGATINLSGASAGSDELHHLYEMGSVVSNGGNNYYCIQTHIDQDPATAVAYWHQLTGTALELPSPYAEGEIFDVQFAQSADVMTMTHFRHLPIELRRYGDTAWTVERALFWEFTKSLAPPAGVVATATYGSTLSVRTVAATLKGGFANGAHITTGLAPHFLGEGDSVRIAGASSRGIADGYYLAAHTADASNNNDLFLIRRDTGEYQSASGSLPWSPAGAVTLRYAPYGPSASNSYKVTAVSADNIESEPSSVVTVTDNALFVEGAYNTITWNAVTNAERYHVYKKQDGVYGYIGQVDADETLSFVDDNIAPDMGITPPIVDDALSATAVSVTINVNTITWAFHDLVVDDPVWFTQVPASTLTEWVRYFVSEVVDVNTIKVAATVGGSSLTWAGSGAATGRTADCARAVGYYQQRRCFGGSRRNPQQFWATRSGTESDLRYSLPLKDDDRLSFVIAARHASEIRHIVPMGDLLLLTSSAEYRVTPVNSDALTPTSVSVRPQSHIGANTVAPQLVNNTVVFCGARGGHVYEMGYQAAAQGYLSGDLALRAAHLFDDLTVLDSAQMKAPQPILWFVSSGGSLLGLTYIPEENVAAWHQHKTTSDGGATFDTFESCCVVPEGDEDRLYVVVKRGSSRYIERMDVMAVQPIADGICLDSAVTETGTAYAAGASFPTTASIAHLNGKTCTMVIEGVPYTGVAVAAGACTMPAAAAGTDNIILGLPYNADLQTLPAAVQFEALGMGRAKNVNRVWVRVVDSASFQVGPGSGSLKPSDPYVTTEALADDVVDVSVSQEWTDDGQLWIRQNKALPLVVVGMAMEVSLGG